MDRRTFLKITFTAGAALAVPVAVELLDRSPLPTIWGDGTHDDTAGMQAAINGEPFYAIDDCVQIVGGKVQLTEGHTHRISRPLHLGAGDGRGFSAITIPAFDAEIGLPDEVFDGGPA